MDFPTSQPDVGLVGGVFVDENPATGQPGSRIPASWGNQVTQEIKAVLAAAAIEPSDQASDQLVEAIQKLIVESTADTGGLPRFAVYPWTGRGDAMPEGDTQSSGQQLLDLMYPTMRVDVMATQFNCTEAEWQASPLKRLTHWSQGDGASWMRPPDKNCVQPGSVEGGFYASGVGSQSALLGTAVLDTLQGHAHEVYASLSVVSNTSSGQVPMNNGAHAKTNLVAKTIISDGANGDPRVAAITKPRTWYGIWMIRMYGRVTNAGDLNAPALNARMDMIDARVATLEGLPRAFGAGWVRRNVMASRLKNVWYTNPSNKHAMIVTISTNDNAARGATSGFWIRGVDGIEHEIVSFDDGAVQAREHIILPGESYKQMTWTDLYTWSETTYG